MSHLIAAAHPAGHPAPIPYFGVTFAGILGVLIVVFTFVIRAKSQGRVGAIMPLLFFLVVTVLAGIGGNFPQVSALVKSVTQGRLP